MRLLDLFCGAGGCTRGYQEAGFEVVGVDLHPQPNYVGEGFVQGDALEALRCLIDGGEVGCHDLEEYDAIHASPPCQNSSTLKARWQDREHPELIPQTRDLLLRSGLPYVMPKTTKVPEEAVKAAGDALSRSPVKAIYEDADRLGKAAVRAAMPILHAQWEREAREKLEALAVELDQEADACVRWAAKHPEEKDGLEAQRDGYRDSAHRLRLLGAPS